MGRADHDRNRPRLQCLQPGLAQFIFFVIRLRHVFQEAIIRLRPTMNQNGTKVRIMEITGKTLGCSACRRVAEKEAMTISVICCPEISRCCLAAAAASFYQDG